MIEKQMYASLKIKLVSLSEGKVEFDLRSNYQDIVFGDES